MFLLIIQPSTVLGLLLRGTAPFAESSIWPTGAMSGKDANFNFSPYSLLLLISFVTEL